MKRVFVDTSGFYALLAADDPYHAQSKRLFKRAARERWRLVTTNYIVHETWALVQARLGWEALEDWRWHVLVHCEVAWIDEALHARAASRCQQARERRLSLTDCVSIEWMQSNGVNEAIAQDEHFERAGIGPPRDQA